MKVLCAIWCGRILRKRTDGIYHQEEPAMSSAPTSASNSAREMISLQYHELISSSWMATAGHMVEKSSPSFQLLIIATDVETRQVFWK